MTKDSTARFDPSIGLDICHVTVAPPFVKTMDGIKKELDWFLESAAKNDNVRMIRNFQDTRFEGLRLIGGLQYPPEDASVSDLKFLREKGVLFTTLAYEGASPFGGGFAVPNAPLTDKGKEFLFNLSEAKMILDLSHAGHRTAREALDFLNRERLSATVVASHTACHSVYAHQRNLPDDVLERLNMVGIVAVTFMLDEHDDTMEPFYRHFKHAVDLLGESFVAIGTDGIYKTLNLAEMEKNFQMMKEKVDPHGHFKARFPAEPVEINSPAKMKMVEQKLFEVGFSESTVRKAVGGNLNSFLASVI